MVAMEVEENGQKKLKAMSGQLYFGREVETVPMPYYRPHDWILRFAADVEEITFEELNKYYTYRCEVGEDGSLTAEIMRRTYPDEGPICRICAQCKKESPVVDIQMGDLFCEECDPWKDLEITFDGKNVNCYKCEKPLIPQHRDSTWTARCKECHMRIRVNCGFRVKTEEEK